MIGATDVALFGPITARARIAPIGLPLSGADGEGIRGHVLGRLRTWPIGLIGVRRPGAAMIGAMGVALFGPITAPFDGARRVSIPRIVLFKEPR